MYVRKLLEVICWTLVGLVAGSLAYAATPTITDARFGQNGSTLRFVLESDKPIAPTSVFALESPDRLVIDFPTLEVKTKLNKMDTPDSAMVKGVRSSPFSPTKYRIVLDLKQAVNVSRFTIPPRSGMGHRLVFDLSPAGRGASTIAKVTEDNRPSPKAGDDYVPSSAFDDVKHQKNRVVIIDPGHGGVDPGAIGKYKTREKDVVLRIAQRAKAAIDKMPGYEAHLTRNSDVFVRLSDRVKKAQKHDGDVFLSLHADAHNDRRISGGTVYVLSEKSSDKEAERLARIANEGDLFAGIDLSHEPKEVQNILIDLTQRGTLNESARLARKMVLSMEKAKLNLRSRETKFAGFRVLKAPEIPSVLIEMAYISNPRDERNLKRKDYQEQIATAIADGVKSYFEDSTH